MIFAYIICGHVYTHKNPVTPVIPVTPNQRRGLPSYLSVTVVTGVTVSLYNCDLPGLDCSGNFAAKTGAYNGAGAGVVGAVHKGA